MEKIKAPMISAILPVYNGENYLEESIQSILDQNYKNFEFIIINDCSTDKTKEIISKYKKIDKRIIYIENKKNMGSSYSFNRGVVNAKGKYLAMCTADDISHPHRFAKEVEYLEKHKNIFLVGTSGIFIDEMGKEIRRFRKYKDSRLLAWRLRKSCSIIFPSIMMKNENVSFDDYFKPADDYNLYFELLKKGKKLINITPFLIKIRMHSTSASSQNTQEQEKQRDRVIEKFKELPDENILFKIYFMGKLAIHALKTYGEKKIKTK